MFAGMDAILVGPSFGERGIEGKISRRNMPARTVFYLGICPGHADCPGSSSHAMSAAKDAHSNGTDAKTPDPVVGLITDGRTPRAPQDPQRKFRQRAAPCAWARKGVVQGGLAGCARLRQHRDPRTAPPSLWSNSNYVARSSKPKD